MLRTFLARLRGTFDRDRQDDEFDEEAGVHVEMLTRRFVERGMSAIDAADLARRQFGRVIRVREDLRARRALPGVDAIASDFRHAFRQLRRAPGFAAAAVATLALGIGASTAVFAVVDAVMLRPLPYADPDRLMDVRSIDRRGAPHPEPLSYPTFFDFRSSSGKVFEHLVSYRDSTFVLTDTTPAIKVTGEVVSWDLFGCLGVQPMVGRGFLPDDEKPGTHVVVLSYNLWKSRFNGDARIVGRMVRIDGEPYTVVGVAPAHFQFPFDGPDVQLWATLSKDAPLSEPEPLTQQRGARTLGAIGRLKAGATPEQAGATMDQIARVLAERYPGSNQNVAKTLVRSEHERLTGSSRTPLLTLLGAVGLVLLIACANVANLLLVRATERSREFALRTAIGASRRTLGAQLLIESLTLGVLGTAAGVLLSAWALHAMLPLAGDGLPRLSSAAIDGRVLAFCAVLAMVTSVLFGLAPAIQAAAAPPVDALKQEGRSVAGGPSRLRNALVVAQVALGLILLVGAELFISSFVHLVRRDVGFRADHLLTFDIGLADGAYPTPRQIAFTDRLLERLRALPGVRSAAIGSPLPLTGHQMSVSFDIEERRAAAPDRPGSDMAIVTPGYFGTMGIPVLKGREFTEHDNTSAPRVLVVNEAFARKFFPGEDVMGKRVESGATNATEGSVLREIVGVVGDATQSPFGADPDPIYYFPYKQLTWFVGTIVLRTDVRPREIEAAAQAAVASLDPQVPLFGVRTGDEQAGIAIQPMRFLMTLMGAFAAIALLLTVSGLYGLLSYTVARRRREIGVRIALGAKRSEVVGLVLGQAMRLVIGGILVGAAGAWYGGRLLQAVLFEVRPGDPLTLAGACGLLLASALVAAYRPASRAASVDPMQALRSE